MNERLDSRQRRRELLITFSFTIFSVLMIIVTTIERWPIWYIPLIAAEIAFIWWGYITKAQTYVFRAFMVTFMACVNIFLYGINSADFWVIIPTLSVQFVLLSLYEIIRVMDIVVIQNIALFLYHWLALDHLHIPDTSIERNRMTLQLVSFVILMILCIYRIRHHIQEEVDVNALEDQIKREQKIKDDFMANTSHELRTPVNTIAGMCEILLQKSLPDDIHRGVLDIQMTGTELQNVVTDIMDYASLESGTLPLNPIAYNITSTLNDVMNRTVFEMREKNLEILFDCDPNIPCLLEGDELQLRRVLNNLVSNAIKFTNDGGVIVRISYRPEEYGINLIVSVKDTGTGLNIEEQDQILRGFYQADADRNRRNSGLGLGLPISYELIKKMGGFLTIRSQVGQGSEFSFAIPQKVINDQPCISVMHPGRIKLVWYYNNPPATVSTIREAISDQINHFSEYFGILTQRATSLEECKRRIAQGQGVHLIIGQQEYLQDKAYFDDISDKISVILIAKRNEILSASPHIHVLYTPYNALMLAEILNGSDRTVPAKREKKPFIAPTAKILAVDDNLMNLKVVEGLLRKYRIKIVAAYSGEDALNLIESKDFDLVFMDHMMPGMDGVECFHHIRNKQDPYFSYVPIIALTANAITGSREMFLSEGFNEFVAKPIDTSHMDDVLRRFIPFEKQIYDDERAGATKEEIAIASQELHLMDEKTKSELMAVSKAADKAGSRAYAGTKEKTSSSKDSSSRTSQPTQAPSAAPTSQASAGLTGSFDALPGVDKETALTYCGTEEDFKELVDVYLSSGKKYLEDLDAHLKNNDLKNYAIIAHSIKSSSKTLGALHLSDIAYGQEMAGKEENAEEVKKNHENLLNEYRSILSQLSCYLGREDIFGAGSGQSGQGTDSADSAPDEKDSSSASNLVPLDLTNDVKDWDDLKEKLIASLESYEVGAVDSFIASVRGSTLGGMPIEDVLSGVVAKVSGFDFEGAIAELKEIGGPEC